MNIKLFEVRDRSTFLAVMAIVLRGPVSERELWLLRRAGYDGSQITGPEENVERYVILCKLDGVEAQYDPHAWSGRSRTMPLAHDYIIKNWKNLTSGEVIDVEFILGESKLPKDSEQTYVGY